MKHQRGISSDDMIIMHLHVHVHKIGICMVKIYIEGLLALSE